MDKSYFNQALILFYRYIKDNNYYFINKNTLKNNYYKYVFFYKSTLFSQYYKPIRKS